MNGVVMEKKVFVEFPKIPRMMRDCYVTEKIDGTNTCVSIEIINGDLYNGLMGRDPSILATRLTVQGNVALVRAGSRTRWITPTDDHYGFAAWVQDNAEDLISLGHGEHHGEWWGYGIQRGYDLGEKRFSLFNSSRWGDNSPRPTCCHVVPLLYHGNFSSLMVYNCWQRLAADGSVASPGYPRPEGVVVYHVAANMMMKYTGGNDGVPKSQTP